MSLNEVFTCKDAVSALREKGYTLTESTIDVAKQGVSYNINSFTISRPCGYVKIYDRGQYATDNPRVGLFIEAGGMNYGDRSANYRISCLNDILRHFVED